MSITVTKKKYVDKIQKILEALNFDINIDWVDVNDYSEEYLFMEFWEVCEMYNARETSPQLFQLWVSRIKEAAGILPYYHTI